MSPFDAAQYWETRLSSHYTLQGVGYSSLGRSFNEWMYRVRKHVFRRLMNSLHLDLKNTTVLDVGSGTGFYIDLWKRLGVQSVTGVDITQTAVDNLKRRFPENRFYQADIGTSLPWTDTYGAITAFDVLFHIVSDENFSAAIRNCYQALQPNGVFIFSDNFLHRPRVELEHQVSRSLDDIQRVVTDAGFRIEKRVPMFSVMNYPVDSESRFRKLYWKALNRAVSIGEPAGFVVGAAVYPLELWLTRSGESTTTEIMVCRKPGR
jgi:SAM-dependent methyltransferase